jgi:hypothetical protein
MLPTAPSCSSTTSAFRKGSLVRTVERLVADGKYELAASLLESTGDRFDHSPSVRNAKRLVYQNTDPFKFIIYSGRIGEQTPQLAPPNSTPGNAVSPGGGR